jgi:hypothetical protein
MFDSEELIRERTEYARLASGEWEAAFAGREWHIVVRAPTLERARSKILAAFDKKLFGLLCDDLGLTEENRPRSIYVAGRSGDQ